MRTRDRQLGFHAIKLQNAQKTKDWDYQSENCQSFLATRRSAASENHHTLEAGRQDEEQMERSYLGAKSDLEVTEAVKGKVETKVRSRLKKGDATFAAIAQDTSSCVDYILGPKSLVELMHGNFHHPEWKKIRTYEKEAEEKT